MADDFAGWVDGPAGRQPLKNDDVTLVEIEVGGAAGDAPDTAGGTAR